MKIALKSALYILKISDRLDTQCIQIQLDIEVKQNKREQRKSNEDFYDGTFM